MVARRANRAAWLALRLPSGAQRRWSRRRRPSRLWRAKGVPRSGGKPSRRSPRRAPGAPAGGSRKGCADSTRSGGGRPARRPRPALPGRGAAAQGAPRRRARSGGRSPALAALRGCLRRPEPRAQRVRGQAGDRRQASHGAGRGRPDRAARQAAAKRRGPRGAKRRCSREAAKGNEPDGRPP